MLCLSIVNVTCMVLFFQYIYWYLTTGVYIVLYR